MQRCLFGLIVIIISILIGAKTTFDTNSESAILQEEQPKPRPEKSRCLLHCANGREVISEKCAQDCEKDLKPGNDRTQDDRERVMHNSLIRSRRSVENNMKLVNECKTSPNYPKAHTVNGLTADFKSNEPDVKILWEAMDPLKTDFNWTTYAVIYTHSTETKANCKVIPQNQTQYLVPAKLWKNRGPIYVQVVTHPYNEESTMELKYFDPSVGGRAFTPTIAEKDTSKLVTSILGGVLAGLVLLVALCFAIKWKKYRRCPEINYTQPPPTLQRTDSDDKEMYYACYYPEGEEFREHVASIVNYFRQNGYNVIMDVMASGEITAQGPTRWAENQIRRAKKVLVFLTPGLVNLSQDGRSDNSQSQDINRVWIELEVLRDIYTRNRSASKMVCITLPDAPIKSMALPLWAKISYKWPADAQEILKRLNNRPKILPV